MKIAVIFLILVSASFLFRSGDCGKPTPPSDALKREIEHGLITEYSCHEGRGLPFAYYNEWHGFAPQGKKWSFGGTATNLIIYGVAALLVGYGIKKMK